MEAVFFRSLVRELMEALPGARVEKVFLPVPNVATLTFYLPAGRVIPGCEAKKTVHLHVRYGTGRYFLFLSGQKTAQPERAPSAAMRLRKYLRGRRVRQVVADWPRRRLVLAFTGEGPALALDPRSFPVLIDAPAPEQPTLPEPAWPSLEAAVGDPDIWQAHPQLSPNLRRRLIALPATERSTVYSRLAAGAADGFFLEQKNGEPLALWPVDWPGTLPRTHTVKAFATALEAAAAFGLPLAFGEVSGRRDAPEVAAGVASRRRQARAMDRLAADETRMRAFIARKVDADAIAANLHTLNKTAKIPELSLPTPEGGRQTLRLDPALTILGNMQKLYHLAAKGERGLAAIATRRRDLQGAKKDLQGREHRLQHAAVSPSPSGSLKGVAAHVYRTSDGFLALRGKNAKANDQLLRLASPFDLWFHAADGPGAHVILRRDHPGREVPRQSLLEAAGLAALASCAAGSGAADVWMARVGDVRRVKGAAPGQVTVSRILETVRAAVDPTLESLREPT
ncbi:NFACT RNA binding domain-containing protein [Desulfovibrio sp. TomC]|uniref:NFACT RNA binding domain-containing protein n=1 Tax=Desulfovibrio sp. TomC TaxID=1562888 RepID=UPI0005BE3EAB|nr:NFACT RNA binding domain-containing protein [Desulfovibrio sp. TomC]